jgi:hypothetical protein
MPSMIVNKKLVPVLKKVMLTASAVFALMQCSEEDELITPAGNPAIEAAQTNVANVNAISSLTVSGVNTTFATAKDCKTCTFVIAEGTELVDGKALGVKAGDVICLNAAFKYGSNLEFINIEGSEESPVVITTVGGAENAASPEGTQSGDPY